MQSAVFKKMALVAFVFKPSEGGRKSFGGLLLSVDFNENVGAATLQRILCALQSRKLKSLYVDFYEADIVKSELVEGLDGHWYINSFASYA